MLDEGLEILTGLWSGQSFNYTGKHYWVKDTVFTPTPIQSPRIPIWVAGNWPNKAPFRRAARWDGMVPQVDPEHNELDQLKDAIQYVQRQRQNDGRFDVVYSTSLGPGKHAPPLKERAAHYKELGVTWLLEQLYPVHFGGSWQGVWPLESMRQRVLLGPPT
jgi:alkanesulfonate monooxygenase SsuD/methylene tetrahydromethanopterin reductase-like flavin-dependent oxidoreductase (luciferase family)